MIEKDVKYDGTYGYFRPRLAVADSGEIHVIWNTQADPSHVVIRDDKIVSTRSIRLTPRASKGDDIDIEALTDGCLILVYQVADGEREANKEAIYICHYTDGKWGEASATLLEGGGSWRATTSRAQRTSSARLATPSGSSSGRFCGVGVYSKLQHPRSSSPSPQIPSRAWEEAPHFTHCIAPETGALT